MNSTHLRSSWKHRFWFVYRWLAQLRFQQARETIHVSATGERYIINHFSFVERLIKEGGFEEKRVAYFRHQLTAGNVFIDIGANIGFYTIIAAQKGASVYAFEPDPINYRRLLRNVELNGGNESRVKTYNCAVGDATGHATLTRPFNDNYGMASIVTHFSPDGISVPVRRLDDVLPTIASRCVIKVDVEGAELAVLDGAESFLRNAKEDSLWLVEVHAEDGVDVDSVAERFLRSGYVVSYFNDFTGEITPAKYTTGDILLLAQRVKSALN